MAGRDRRPFAAGIAVGAALGLGLAGFLCGRVDSRPPHSSAGAERERQAGSPASAGGADAAPPPAPVAAAPPVAPAAAGPAVGPPADAPAVALPMPPPRDALDTPEWRSARLAFRPRELGKLGPYVKVGLDAARRDMGFCFQRAAARAGPAPAAADQLDAPNPPDDAAPPSAPDPAILLLYMEAREGALDIVDTRTEHLGTSSPELVECCREVLRGMEIKAFGTVPGRRYRIKFRLR